MLRFADSLDCLRFPALLAAISTWLLFIGRRFHKPFLLKLTASQSLSGAGATAIILRKWRRRHSDCSPQGSSGRTWELFAPSNMKFLQHLLCAFLRSLETICRWEVIWCPRSWKSCLCELVHKVRAPSPVLPKECSICIWQWCLKLDKGKAVVKLI